MVSIDWFWTCAGECFGYREDNALFTYDGRQVGRFAEGDEIYGRDGRYLGEICRTGRLITNTSKKNWTRAGFSPTQGRRFSKNNNVSPKEIRLGYEDFPGPKQFS
jgi:hypothetical protein